MTRRDVYLEWEGKSVLVGSITGDVSGEASFSYAPSYLSDGNAVAVSVSLPLREEPFSPEQTRCFFDGLLPEGFTRQSVAAGLRVDVTDYLSILSALGSECIGALRIVTDGESPAAPSYEELSVGRMRALASGDASYSAQMMTGARLSLAGASGKTGLYYDEETDTWYLPHGTAPGTHIVKQAHVRLKEIVLNEQLCMLTAAHLGIETPDSFVVRSVHEEPIPFLFATKRFDRWMPPSPERIDGLQVPVRLHQEDFAQALGIPSERKYEADGGDYLKQMTELLLRVSADPVADIRKLWERILFHYMIGNADGHLKNFSLLYSPDFRSVRLSPAYDIVNTMVYDETSRRLPFRIGGVDTMDALDREAFFRAAKETGIGRTVIAEIIERYEETFPDALERARQTLLEEGFDGAETI